jgi:hypothetical protein
MLKAISPFLERWNAELATKGTAARRNAEFQEPLEIQCRRRQDGAS